MKFSFTVLLAVASTVVLAIPNSSPALSSLELEARAKRDCRDLATRDPKTCECLPEFDDPGKPKKECLCPDYPNTALAFSKEYNDQNDEYVETAFCWCRSAGQSFNKNTRKCECPPGFKATHNTKNELQCKLSAKPTTITTTKTTTPTNQPTGGTKQKVKKALQDLLTEQSEENLEHLKMWGSVEQLMGCDDYEKACEVDGAWHCTNLSTCGGCMGETIDCASLPGANGVSCRGGKCIVDSCQRGFTLKYDRNSTSTLPAYCVPK